MKKLLSGILAAVLVTTMLPLTAMASDIDNNWAKQYITSLYEKQIMLPSGTNFKPNAKISRAEFMRYLNRAFQFTETANVSFSDVKAGEWYYSDVCRAVKYGYINGTGNGKMNPLGTLTREEAATIIGRLHKNTPQGSDSLDFTDKSSISSWSAPYINEAVEKKYIVGYPDNTFRPKGEITRSEISKILYYFMGTRLDQGSVYAASDVSSDRDNVTITAAGSQLSDVTINGDLYISEGIKEGAVSLRGVTVKGMIVVGGGTVNLTDVTANKLVVSSPVGRRLTVNAIGTTNVGTTLVRSSASLSESDLDISAGGFSDVTVNAAATCDLTLDADVWNLNVESAATVNLPTGAVVNELKLTAAATVNGEGAIEKAIIKSSGVKLDIEPSKYEIDNGISAEIKGQAVSGSNSSTVTPSSATFDKYIKSVTGGYKDIEVTVSAGADAVTLVTCDGTTLKEGDAYRITQNVFKFYKATLGNLDPGSHTIEFVLQNKAKAIFLLNVIDSSQTTLSQSQVDFDRYEKSAGYQDVVITVNGSYGNILKQIMASGTVLSEGTDYIYKSGVVTIYKTFIVKRPKGVMNITFDMNEGNDPQLSINIADSSPVNAVVPATVKFDANASSSNFDDVKVTLRRVNGAKLENIKVKSQLLTPTQDYYVLDENTSTSADSSIVENTVVLRKKALQNLSTSNTDYINLIFMMDKGESPELNVKYINTYVAKFVVTDDGNQPVKGATVTIGDSKATTDASGIASFNLENGDYTAKISSGNAKTVEKTFTISKSSREMAVTLDVLYDVSITVTEATGANISGATVTLGTATAKTGGNGVATFQTKRGPYQMKVTCTGYTTQITTISVTETVNQRVILSKS